MAGSERRNNVVVVFMGRNGMRGRVHREGLDGRGDGNEAWRTAQWRKRTPYGRNVGPVDREGCYVSQNGGNGLVLERYGRNGVPVNGEGCGVPQNRGNGPPTVETGVLLIGRGVAYRKTEEMDLLRSDTILPSRSCSLLMH